MNSELADFVRRNDRDRYFCTLFAPPGKRNTLLCLYALDHELARAGLVTSQPTLALIRLQWWREVVEGEARRHEVAAPLLAEIEAGRLSRELCLRMIEGREMEAEGGFEALAVFESYCLLAHGSVMEAAGGALGCVEAEAMRRLGAGCGAVWAMRKRPALLPPEPVEVLARGWLESPVCERRCPAVLPAVLARRDLRRARASGNRGIIDLLAVTRRAWFGV